MKNFVFDIYGTLVDIHTDENNPKFIKAMCEYFGREDFMPKYKKLCALQETGDGLCEIDLFKVFFTLAPNDPQKAADYFRKKSRSKLKLYFGLRSFLKKLKGQGAKLYILSNAQSCFTVNELKKLRIYNLFDGIELSSDFGKKKPSKEFFEHIVSKYSLDISDTVYIGNDFVCDILGAKAVGLATAYIKSNCSPLSDDVQKISSVADFATEERKKLYNYLLSLT